MQLTITLILETEKSANALRVTNRLNQLIGASEPRFSAYHKGGTKAVLMKPLQQQAWPNAVLEALLTAQKFGRAWTILESIQEELNLVGNEFAVCGITWAEVSLSREDNF